MMHTTDNNITMSFKTEEVSNRLKENKNKHETEYKEAKKEYVKTVQKKLEEALKKVSKAIDAAKAGKVKLNNLGTHEVHNLPEPHSYSKEYARVISMLEATCDETIELTSNEFDRFMNDNWDWSNDFAATSSMYLSN